MGRTGAWRWPDLDQEEAVRLVRPHLPDGVRAPLTLAGEGDFCLAYRAGGWIVRLAKHAEAAEALRREARVLARVADHLPLDVPGPTLHEPEGCPPFTVHREVVGAPLTRAAWEGLPRVARVRAAERLADFLSALHASARHVGTAWSLPRLDETVLAARLRREAPLALSDLLAPAVLQGLDARLAAGSNKPESGPPALLHCDIAPGHLLYDEATGALTGVIDFGDVALGPAARDFIFLYEDFGAALCGEVLTAYAGSAGAEAPTLADVRSWYLLEALSWTLERIELAAQEDAAHGLAEIERELRS